MMRLSVASVLMSAALVLLLVGAGWAAPFRLSETEFMRWVQTQQLPGFVADEESLENYDDREFTLDFMATGAPQHLSIKIEPGSMAELKGDPNLATYVEGQFQGRRLAYCTLKSMAGMSLLYLDLPERGAQLRLLTAPQKSRADMERLLAAFDLSALR